MHRPNQTLDQSGLVDWVCRSSRRCSYSCAGSHGRPQAWARGGGGACRCLEMLQSVVH